MALPWSKPQTSGSRLSPTNSYQQEDADFSVQIGHINAAGAGAIIMIGQGNAVVTVANNVKHLGLTKMLLLGSINERPTLLAAGNVLGSQFLFPSPMIQVAEDDLSGIEKPQSRAAAEAFVKPLKAEFGDSDPGMASRAWDSIMMMAMAAEEAKSIDGTAMRDALEKLGHYDGAGASYDFSATQHVGIVTNPYVIAYVGDGKLRIKQ